MNWYKYSQVATTIGPPPTDINLDNDENEDDECWRDFSSQISEWVKKNLKSGPILQIEKEIIENIALYYFDNGMDLNVSLWHPSIDFFVSEKYRAATVSLNFSGFLSGKEDGIECFNLSTKTSEWINLLRTSTLLTMLQGLGCKIKIIDEELYLYVLGEIMNGIAYYNKNIAESFQLYLDKNIDKMSNQILQYIKMDEISRYMTKDQASTLTLGEEVNGQNLGFKCYPKDYRFDDIGIQCNREATLYINMPEDVAQEVLEKHGKHI